MQRSAFRSFAALVLIAAATASSAEPSATERYFAGLRQRTLFDLAEGEALRRLAEPNLSDAERADLTAELARAFAEHAVYLDGAERSDLWNRAAAAIDEFLATHPKDAGRTGLELLRGELDAGRGEALRWLAELVPERPRFRADANAALSDATRRLAEVETGLEQRLKDRRTRRNDPLEAEELDALLARARLTLAAAELDAARLLPPEGRAAPLAAAERRLEPLARGPRGEETTWRASVLFAEAARLAGDGDAARKRLAELDSASLTAEAKDAYAAIGAKLLLDAGRPDKAVAFLIDYRRTRGSLTGELRLLQVRSLVEAAAAVDRLGNAAEAQELRAQVPETVRWAEAEHGGYWADRARLAARAADRAAEYGAAAAEKLRLAEAAHAAGRTDEAAAAYAEAERLAASANGKAEIAFARASLLLRADRFPDAAAAFRGLSEAYPDSPQAGEAHLLSAYALGRWHDVLPSEERRESYAARLEEHRVRFRGGPTFVEATWRLARLKESRRQYTQAIPLHREIIADPDRGSAAKAGVARSYEALIDHLRTARRTAATPEEAAIRDRQLAEWDAAAAEELSRLSVPLGSPESKPETWSAADAELALRTARLSLSRPDADPTDADRLLAFMTAASANRPASERTFWDAIRETAPPLRIVALAGRGRYAEADRLVAALPEDAPADLLAVLTALNDLPEPTGPQPVRPRLSDVRQRAADRLAAVRSKLSSEQARRADLALARAAVAGGDPAAAAERFAALVSARPQDKTLLAQAGTELLAAGAPVAARDCWRRLEGLEPPGSAAWFAARRKTIEATLAAGEPAEAKKLMAVTRLLHPTLGDEDSRAAFEKLAGRIDAAK